MSFEKPELNKPEKRVVVDREAEKEKRKEIRKMLERALTEALKPAGFKKEGSSTWLREIKDKIQMVYLQRSQFGHNYYLETGVCDSKDLKDRPLHITDCRNRERIEAIFSKLKYGKSPEKEPDTELENKIREEEQKIGSLLDFEIPHEIPKKLEDYEIPIPSVDIAETRNKIETFKKIVEENVPEWLDKQL